MQLYWENVKRSYLSLIGHTTPKAEIQRIMQEAGFTYITSFDFLAGQSFNIFRKEKAFE